MAAQTGMRAALVTGGARGMGVAHAQRLLADGFAVMVIDINSRRLADLDPMVEEHGGAFAYREASITEPDQMEEVVAEIVERWGHLDVLVNNAGQGAPGGLFEHSVEDFDRVLHTNVTGMFIATRAAAAAMRDGIEAGRQQGGAVVSIGSVAGAGVSEGMPAYSASKAGVHVLTKVFAKELGPLGIRVNAIAPGTTLTDWVRRNIPESAIEASREHSPLGRSAEPEDIAAVVSFLVSDDARHITGHVISVSGGEWMP